MQSWFDSVRARITAGGPHWQEMFVVENLPTPLPTLLTGSSSLRQATYQVSSAPEQRTMAAILSIAAGCNGELAVNVGANDGIYAITLAQLGCRVIALEPQPLCVEQLQFAAAMADTQFTVDVHQKIVSDGQFSISVPGNICSGVSQYEETTGMHAVANHAVQPSELAQSNINTPPTTVHSVSLNSIVNDRDVRLLLIDCEGAEFDVLRSGAKTFATQRIFNAIIELKPHGWAGVMKNVDRSALATEFIALATKQEWHCLALEEYTGPATNIHAAAKIPAAKFESTLQRLVKKDTDTNVWCQYTPTVQYH
jgi:FkbM family methyltransferase